ncbi:MAG: hypothetical protein DRG82_08745 [Deltaproteobacteria bacterium]|nr:MAG: hypothetical protein B1H13_12030 [Desulfobacteraceae bacterium 4484_190.3]RLB16559.1 MAG: hypothetical protein DRG82_08745 [Deltaproteobacteria bacterium]
MKIAKRLLLFTVTLVSTFFFVGILFFASPPQASAKEKKDLPPRSIAVYPEYTGVVVTQGDDVSVDLTVANRGRHDEDVILTLTSIPDGWKARIKTYSFGVTGVHVESDKAKNLTLRAEPGPKVKPGTYHFPVQARTTDNRLTTSCEVTVTVQPKTGEKVSKGINIISSYPVLRGPTDAKFEFSLEIENKLDKDSIFNLSAKGPENWDINFKPAYEQKFISSVRLKADQSQTVAVSVKPYPLAEPGKYTIQVRVSSPVAKAESTLTVILTGTYKLEAGTPNGLLSLNALQGKTSNFSIYVKNTGSAILNNITFLSFKPENWKVKFKPERIDALAPEELKQVEISVTPSDQALVGDYSLTLRAEAGNPPKADKSIELRATVRASAFWGWVGIAIILFVLAGLVYLFIRLGRR